MGSPKIAYLVSEYPAVSHTFIQREVESLRAHSVDVSTFSIREPSAASLRGDAERQAHATTEFIFPRLKSPKSVLGGHIGCFCRNPRQYLSALKLAFTDRPAGLVAMLFQLAYFTEAAILAQSLRKAGIQHLHVHFANAGCTVGMLASEMTGVPYSFTMHGPTEFFDIYRLGVPGKLKRASFVACISHFCRSQLMLFSDQADWNKFHIVHCAIDSSIYQNDDVRRRHNVLFVGRMAGVKGVPLLVESLIALRDEFPDLNATLVGDGPERAALEAQVAAAGLDDLVRFTGYQTQAEVAAHLKAADIFVLASFAEGLPVVLMEAMASGVPVITTQIAGVGDLVEDGVHGCLIAPGDQDGLTNALRGVLEDDKGRVAMGQAGPPKIKTEFDSVTEAAKLASLFGA